MVVKTEVLNTARSQLGYNGTGSSGMPYSKYGEAYGINPGHWCAMFLDWCQKNAPGYDPNHKAFVSFAYCPAGQAWFQSRGRYFDTPEVGDIVFFDFGMGRASHVGFVESVTSWSIVTLEGNTTDYGQGRTGNSMRRKEHALTSPNILGYGRPEYSTDTPSAPPAAPAKPSGLGSSNTRQPFQLPKGVGFGRAGVKLPKGATKVVDGTNSPTSKANVIRMQRALARKGYPLTGTGTFGPATEAAVRDFQKKSNGKVKVTGVVGPKTWELIGVTE